MDIMNQTYQMPFGQRILAKFPWLADAIFFVSFELIVLTNFIQGTMLYKNQISSVVVGKVQIIAGILAVLKVLLFDDKSISGWLLTVFVGVLLWQSATLALGYDIFYYFLLLIAAKNVNFKYIAASFFATTTVALLLVFSLAKLGIIPNLSFTKANGTFALGMNYPTDLAARMFYLLAAYALLKNFALSLPEKISFLAVVVLTYTVTHTRVDLLVMLLLLLAIIFYKQVAFILEKITNKGITVLLGALVAVLVGASYLYRDHSTLFTLANKIFSNRLSLGNRAFKEYNVTLLGQPIPQQGFGGSSTEKLADYFYIDSSYLRILMMFGAVTFLIFIGLLVYLSHKFMQQRLYAFEIVLILVAISSLIDQHLYDVSFNIILLAALANLDYAKDSHYY